MRWQIGGGLAGHTLAGSASSRSQGPGCCQLSGTLEAWNLMWAHCSGCLCPPLLISFASNQNWGPMCKGYALRQSPLPVLIWCPKLYDETLVCPGEISRYRWTIILFREAEWCADEAQSHWNKTICSEILTLLLTSHLNLNKLFSL